MNAEVMPFDQAGVTIDGWEDETGWLHSLSNLSDYWREVGWLFVQTLRNGIDQFGVNDHRKSDLYEAASQHTGLSPHRLQNLVSMTRNPVSQIAQDYELDFGYAEAVLGIDPDVADSILADAKAHALTVSQVRRIVYMEKNHAPASGNETCPTCGQQIRR